MNEKKYGLVGLIGRWKPLHIGGYKILRAACESAEFVKIGIGSSNKYNLRNPFTSEESSAMITASLYPEFKNFEIIELPDFGHLSEYRDGNKWVENVLEKCGNLDLFVSGNDYVRGLLNKHYNMINSWELLKKEDQIKLRGTYVRVEMAKFGNWENLVPEKVAEYIKENKLDERFRKKFGLKTLASAYDSNIIGKESVEDEKRHVVGDLK